MKTFNIVEVQNHIWDNIYKEPLFCVGIDNGIGETELFSDDYIAEIAGIGISSYIECIYDTADDCNVLVYQYVSDNGFVRSTDTYFVNREDAQRVADYLNGL